MYKGTYRGITAKAGAHERRDALLFLLAIGSESYVWSFFCDEDVYEHAPEGNGN